MYKRKQRFFTFAVLFFVICISGAAVAFKLTKPGHHKAKGKIKEKEVGGITFVHIEGGSFEMGARDEEINSHDFDMKPAPTFMMKNTTRPALLITQKILN